jgi:hypothetical protein
MRDGQRVEITDGVETLEGGLGNLELQFRIAWVEAGNGYHVATGTWKVVTARASTTGSPEAGGGATCGWLAGEVPGAGAPRASSKGSGRAPRRV